jgi:drug/metabolite transporter (DMT)-like permease
MSLLKAHWGRSFSAAARVYMGIGEWAALAAAFFWTLSSLLWGKIRVSALGLNICKNFLAAALIGAHLLILQLLFRKPMLQMSSASIGWLATSGLFGIVIGDTLYFRSIQILGARRALMMATTSPLFAAALAWSLLGEQLQFVGILGIALTVLGVGAVVADRQATVENPGLFPGSTGWGIGLGLLAAVCQAIGGVLSKKGMADCDALEATLIRISVAALATLLIVIWQGQLRRLVQQVFRREVIRYLIPATILGTWLGIWLSQIAYKESSEVAIAQTLMSTCPLFAIPIVIFVYGHRVSRLAWAGTVVAIVGIFLAVK